MKALICISTFNGGLFIDDQLNSILNQSYKNFNILIRDDGSTDVDFIEKLKEYENKYSQIRVTFKENIGVSRSFFELLNSCSSDYDLVILADQDDVWIQSRIEDTIKFISHHEMDSPLLCSCGFEYVDENLNFISRSPIYKHIGFPNALVQNLIPGCTICINKPALRILQSYTPNKAVIHDWWIYLAISATGKVIQDPNVSVKYRQHHSNVLGGTTSFIEKNHRRVRRRLNTMIYKVYDQVREFKSVYYDLISDSNKKNIDRFLKTADNLFIRLLFMFDFNTAKREKTFDNILLKIVILFSGRRRKSS